MRMKIWGAAAALTSAMAMGSMAQAGSLKDWNDQGPVVTPKSTVTFSGADWSNRASYFYSGAIYALNRDLGRDGVVLRGFAGVPQYEYRKDDVIGGWVDGDGVQGDLMIGYMWQREHVTFSTYVGIDYQKYDLTPDDPSSKVNGTEVGFKVAADLASAYEAPLYWNLHGSYSTAFNSYWTRARVGYNSGRFIIGPEAIAMGNDGFDAHRVGGFATIRIPLSSAVTGEISGHLGYQFVDKDKGSNSSGGEGTHGGIGFALVF